MAPSDKLQLDGSGRNVKVEIVDRPLCECHDRPMHSNGTTGARWRCRVKNLARMRDGQEERRETKTARQRDRYDRDPIYRISKLLHDSTRRRGETLTRRKENHGTLQV
jgi:hypothetical protein